MDCAFLLTQFILHCHFRQFNFSVLNSHRTFLIVCRITLTVLLTLELRLPEVFGVLPVIFKGAIQIQLRIAQGEAVNLF